MIAEVLGLMVWEGREGSGRYLELWGMMKNGREESKGVRNKEISRLL
jgi:hypothetical protein